LLRSRTGGHRGGAAETLDSVLIARPELFDGALLTALRRDAAARADAVGEIAGLDFDPFLAGQDPCERYEVGYTGLATSARDRRVPVFAVCGGERAAEPSVVAELSPRDTGWVFVNFLYPATGANLLSVLERLHPVEQAL
jgi:hypothetical protein